MTAASLLPLCASHPITTIMTINFNFMIMAIILMLLFDDDN